MGQYKILQGMKGGITIVFICAWAVFWLYPVYADLYASIPDNNNIACIGPGLIFSSLAPNEYQNWRRLLTQYKDLNKISSQVFAVRKIDMHANIAPALYRWFDKKYNHIPKFAEVSEQRKLLDYIRELQDRVAFDMTMIAVRHAREIVKIKKELPSLEMSPKPWPFEISQRIARKAGDLSLITAIFTQTMKDILLLRKQGNFPDSAQWVEAYRYYITLIDNSKSAGKGN